MPMIAVMTGLIGLGAVAPFHASAQERQLSYLQNPATTAIHCRSNTRASHGRFPHRGWSLEFSALDSPLGTGQPTSRFRVRNYFVGSSVRSVGADTMQLEFDAPSCTMRMIQTPNTEDYMVEISLRQSFDSPWGKEYAARAYLDTLNESGRIEHMPFMSCAFRFEPAKRLLQGFLRECDSPAGEAGSSDGPSVGSARN